jgi:hypothetical protein
VRNNDALVGLDGLGALARVGGEVSLTMNAALASTAALTALRDVGEACARARFLAPAREFFCYFAACGAKRLCQNQPTQKTHTPPNQNKA